MSNNPALQKLFDVAAMNAKRIFEDSGEVLPMWHVVDGNGDNLLLATPWTSDEEKRDIIVKLRELFRLRKVKRLVFMVEAWIAAVRADSEGETPRPSEHPDRREVIIINAEDRDGSNLYGMYYILRPEHGPPTLSPLKLQAYDKTAGHMVGMLS